MGDSNAMDLNIQAAIDAGDFVRALMISTELLACNNDYFSAYANRGFCRYRLLDFKGAVEDYDIYLTHFPNSIAILGNKALALSELGDLDGALAAIETVLQLSPNDPIGVANRSDIFLKQSNRDHEQALKFFAKLQPKNKADSQGNPGGPPLPDVFIQNLPQSRDFFPIEDTGDFSGGERARQTERQVGERGGLADHWRWTQEAVANAPVDAPDPGDVEGAGQALVTVTGNVVRACASCHIGRGGKGGVF